MALGFSRAVLYAVRLLDTRLRDHTLNEIFRSPLLVFLEDRRVAKEPWKGDGNSKQAGALPYDNTVLSLAAAT